MTIRWERFAGRTDRFALRISFMPDPDGGKAADPADSASWGSLQIWVGGQNICAHIDQNEALQGAHWYLLPLLEWFAQNWDPVFHEEKLPNSNSERDAVTSLEATRFPPRLAGESDSYAWDEERFRWRSRHALRTAREGGLFPNIVLRRLRDEIEISWDDAVLAGTPDGFQHTAGSGSALLRPEDVAQPIHEVLTSAVDRLRQDLPGSERIQRLQIRLQTIVGPGKSEARLEWLAGLHETLSLESTLEALAPAQDVQSRWQQIVQALEDAGNPAGASAALAVEESQLVLTGSCHASLMFGSVSPTISAADVRTLSSVIVNQFSSAHADKLAAVSYNVGLDPVIAPWEQGYDLAESTLDQLDVNLSAGFVDIAEVVDRLGVKVLSCTLDDSGIRACCLAGDNFAPAIVRNESSYVFRHAAASRFTLAHELCHLMFDETAGRKLAIASGPWAPRGVEQRANAFAAMFLMPPALVQRAVADLPDPVSEGASIATIAARLQVSRRAVTEHLFNLTLMTETERENLLNAD